MSRLRLIDTPVRPPAGSWVRPRGRRTQVRPGEVLEGTAYRIVRWLGEGGMGVVYEAEHVDLGRRVALKILRPEFSGDVESAERFALEARAVCQVASGYVAQVFDFARLPDGRALFTMELLDGRTLLTEILQGCVGPARAIGLLRQTCKALAAAHDAGIIHRDVKPDNVAVVSTKGTCDTIRLLDFGIHAIVDVHSGKADTGPAGTPSYLAPEAVAGVPVGAPADLYSLGCVAFEMLSGRLPFEHEWEDERLVAHLDEPAPPLNSVAPSVPPALAAVVDRCLRKNPDDRYRDARDLEAALCEAQIAAGIHTDWDDLPLPEVDGDRKESLLRRMPDPLRRPRSRRAAFLLAALVTGVVAVAVALWPRTEPEHLRAVHLLVNEAREAAARAYFVYPPPEEPTSPTAYRKVLELEAALEPGPELANALRAEFASTLTRLGDRYWGEPGGMPFAIDYYAEAIVFFPDHGHAAVRAALTVGQLAAMQRKAADMTFSEGELLAAEPLIALATTDDTDRESRLAQLDRTADSRPASVNASLDRLRRRPGRSPRRDRGTGTPSAEPKPPAEDPVPPAPAEPESSTPDSEPPEAPSASTDPPEDKQAAARSVRRGHRAMSAGRYADAQREFEAAISQDPRNASAFAGLAQVHFERSEYTLAASQGRQAVALARKNAKYRMRLGDAYYKTFRYRRALAQYREAQSLGDASAARAIDKVRVKLAGSE